MIKIFRFPTLILAVILLSSSARAEMKSQADQTIELRGRVSDAQTGEPVAKVKVWVIGADRQTITGSDGAFVLSGLPAGEIELYAGAVGYGLVKKRISFKGERIIEAQIVLNQEAAPLRDAVNVNAGPFPENETNAALGYSLNKQELRTLSTVLVADPVRAAQGLPGVAGNDDFQRFHFAGRGHLGQFPL